MTRCVMHAMENSVGSLRRHLLPNFHTASYKKNKTIQFNTFFFNLKTRNTRVQDPGRINQELPEQNP